MTPALSNHPRIEMMPPDALTPNPRNARTHTDKQISQIGAAIKRFGYLVPIVIDDENMIAAGHGRWEASRRLKLGLVPVIRAKFVTEADRRAFALAENRISELSGWDDKLLAAELNALFDGGYDLDITGFSTADLDFAIPENTKEEPESVELPDPDAEAISLPGDLWLIGPHKLYCGNARDTVSYEALLADERAAMIFSDAPYNVSITTPLPGLAG